MIMHLSNRKSKLETTECQKAFTCAGYTDEYPLLLRAFRVTGTAQVCFSVESPSHFLNCKNTNYKLSNSNKKTASVSGLKSNTLYKGCVLSHTAFDWRLPVSDTTHIAVDRPHIMGAKIKKKEIE